MTDQSETLQSLLQRAVSEHGAGRIGQAEALYREVLARAPRQPTALYLLGVLALQVGRADMAADLISQSLAEKPDNAEAHFNLGNAYLGLGRSADAESAFRAAIQWQPDYASAHYNLGNLEKDAGRLADAESSFRAAIRHAPDLAQAWCNLGLILFLQDRSKEAIDAYSKGLEIAPDLAEAHNNLGNALAKLERYDEAAACYRDALSANPVLVDGFRNLGTVLQKQGLEQEARQEFRRALLLDPAIAENWSNLATLQRLSGDYERAFRWYRFALSLRPAIPSALIGCGSVRLAMKDFEAANDFFKAAIKADPMNSAGWENSGICLQELGEKGAARDAYHKALCLDPAHIVVIANSVLVAQSFLDFDKAFQLVRRGLVVEPLSTALQTVRADAFRASGHQVEAERGSRGVICITPGDTAHYVNLSIMRRTLGKLSDAERDLRRGLVITPEHTKALTQLGELLAEYGRVEEAVALGREAIRGTPDNAMFHHSLLFYLHCKPKLSTAEMMQDYKRFDEAICKPLLSLRKPHRNVRDPRKRLRVGYVGAGFHWHSSASFFLPLLKNHDHANYEIFCYASYPRAEDQVTEAMRTYADHWVLTFGMSDHTLAERIRDDEIDILVDLAGHTKGNRLRVFAQKPAPVAFHWLDHGVTTGLSAMDYFLGDPVFSPEDSGDLFAEKIWNLPRVVFPFEPVEWMETETPSPTERNGCVTFGSVARAVRINDDAVAAWSEVLHRVPGARFCLFNHACRDASFRESTIGRFRQMGIGPERLDIGYRLPATDAFAQIDIMLDTFPHCGGVTTCEGLYLGLPIVTLRGKAAIGTLGSSLLTQIGRTEWIAETVDDYIRIACDLASDISALPDLRSSLRHEMRSSPVMDGVSFARDFENACRGMWEKWCSESLP